MNLFAGLKEIRQLQKLHLPFLRSQFDFDIVIEIGYAEECGEPLTMKEFCLLNVCSRSTARRKLSTLAEQGIIVQAKAANDNRAVVLSIPPSTIKTLKKYGAILTAVATTHFGTVTPGKADRKRRG